MEGVREGEVGGEAEGEGEGDGETEWYPPWWWGCDGTSRREEEDCCVYILRPFSAGLRRIFFRDITGLYWPGEREGCESTSSAPAATTDL